MSLFEEMRKASVIVVSAPSGAGKTTLCRELVAGDRRLRHLVSHTTRAPRPGEVDGRDYTFLGEEEFKSMAERGQFAEWALVHGNYYGTALTRIQEVLAEGDDVLMDIDVQGAEQIRQAGLDAASIFVLPPSMAILEERLRKRASDTEEVIQRRIAKAREEIACYKAYDYLLVNDDLKTCLAEARATISAVRLRVANLEPGWLASRFGI